MERLLAKSNKIFNRRSLSNKILFYILLCSTFLALIITVLQLLWDYRHDVSRIRNNIDQIEASFLEPIAASYWSLDEDQIRVQVDGIMNFPSMKYVMVSEGTEESDAPLIERGSLDGGFDIQREFELVFEGEVVGRLLVAASLKEVYQRLMEKSVLLLASQMIKTFIVSVAILWIIYMVLIRHLNRMVNFTYALDFEGQLIPLQLKGRSLDPKNPDELDILTKTINDMSEKIHDELEERKLANQRLSQEKEFSETIIESSSTIICCMDEDLAINTVNSAGEKLSSTIREDLVGKNWLDIFTFDQNSNALASKIKSSASLQEHEIPMNTTEHGVSTLIWSFVPFYQQGQLQQYIAFGYNVTHLKKIQSELNALNDSLESKVAERTESLEKSNAQLAEAFEQLKQTQNILVESEKMASLGGLVAGIAHEINTPLGISLTAASFLRDQSRDFDRILESREITENDLKEFIDGVGESTDLLIGSLNRASQLVRSFKQVAVDQSSEACYRFHVADNLEQVLTSLNHKLKKANCNVVSNCDPELTITSFPGSFAQIYSNLVINSLIHGFEDWEGDRKILISIEQKEGKLFIDYSDTGKGINAEIAGKIFDPFVTTKRGEGGSGLGTHVIYNLVVQLLKGSIVCKHDVPQGVQFLIELPYKE
ncbi:ATP-binding protein [Vibrio sp. S4M6]|uniref:ATP-binding protein n=1 Tax=Vibrio sinus TaxID=2946865 RepID=UPI00202A5088|nr:ATP-binding protein [Vibrio sinus]MCL9781337.1 ATP-binding protein [Vibrio sinus]